MTNAVLRSSDGTSATSYIGFRCASQILAEAIPKLGEFPNSDVLAVPTTGHSAQRYWDGPTLFIQGGRSGYITEANMKTAGMQFPKSYVHLIERAGHWVHADAPRETARAIADFVVAQAEQLDGGLCYRV